MVLRILIGATCVAINVAVGTWFYDRYQAREAEREAERAAVLRQGAAISAAECDRAADAWNLAKRGKRLMSGPSPHELLASYVAACDLVPTEEDRWYAGAIK